MQATIADIRRGDRYTRNGVEYIAALDACPSSVIRMDPETRGTVNDERFYLVRSVRATATKTTADGTLELTGTISADTVVKTMPVEITERGLPVHSRAEDVRESTPLWQALARLTHVVDARARAQRELEDRDDEFRASVQQFLASGGSVTEAVKRTGLSRARIYQIRDGRR
jgi:hypothetical protein